MTDMKNERDVALTPMKKLQVAHAVLFLGMRQHDVAAYEGINSGRIAEAVKAVREAVGLPEPR